MSVSKITLLSKKEAAGVIGVVPRTLSRWHNERIGPPRIKLGHKVLYDLESLVSWLKSQESSAIR